MKHNYKVARRDYSSIYIKIAEQSKIYTNSLPPDEIDEIENDFRANGMVYCLFKTLKAQQICLIPLQCSTT